MSANVFISSAPLFGLVMNASPAEKDADVSKLADWSVLLGAKNNKIEGIISVAWIMIPG